MARKSRGLTLNEKREGPRKYSEEMTILIQGQDDQRSFKLSSCGAKILTGDNRFQKWAAHGGRIVNRLCAFLSLSSLSLLTLPPSPRLRSFSPHHPLSVISILSWFPIGRFSPPVLFLFLFLYIDAARTIIFRARDPKI